MNKRFVAATTMMAMFVTTAAAATAYQKSITATYGIDVYKRQATHVIKSTQAQHTRVAQLFGTL